MAKSLNDLRVQLQSDDSHDRVLAVVTIGRERIHAAARYVEAALNDSDGEVRAMAMWSLDLLGSPATIPSLIRALYDPVFDVRSNAGWALVHLAKRIFPGLVLPDVIEVLRGEDHYDARQMAYLVLSRIGGEAAEEAIQQYWR
ncbi:MAG: HEAT repeat domain-containing protein [Chloroflexota bacterium]